MSNMDVNQVLAQMRAMAAEAGNATASRESSAADGESFGAMMKDSIAEVSQTQMEAKELATGFELGDKSVALPEVMVALQKANVSFQAMTQVRNKLLNAYQEVMNMQV